MIRVELTTRLPEESSSRQGHIQEALKHVLFARYYCMQRIRRVTIIRYINSLLLTYLLTMTLSPLHLVVNWTVFTIYHNNNPRKKDCVIYIQRIQVLCYFVVKFTKRFK